MTGLETYAIYKSIRLHFNSESYDCFKYNFQAGSTSVESFDIRKDKYCFVRLARDYQRSELQGFLACNFFSSPKLYIRELLSPAARETYQKRKAVWEALSYHFKKDIEFLFAQGDPNSLLVQDRASGDYPRLLQHVLQADIEIETLIVLNYLLNFFPTWNKKITDTIQWPDLYFRIRKYTPFLSFDGSTMKSIVKTVLDNTK